ncbi:MAG: DNA-formamidopyrimidine glycosylase [Desulfuromonas sp.]|nr:MAG: DNA-formamidopyrimidine glycosylase [Desulfuromonas sp.]
MPELPEVETTRRGIAPLLEGRLLTWAILREQRLRHAVPENLAERVAGARILSVGRRAKYLLIRHDRGGLLLHLGMSGTVRVLPVGYPAAKHDHVDLLLEGGELLRYNDPRRFGLILPTNSDPDDHPLLRDLGPEPFDPVLTGEALHQMARKRKSPLKVFLMDQKILVGVGNIYASEALFRARLDPRRLACEVSRPAWMRLLTAVREVLDEAITAGGTTLKDFRDPDGKPGYFGLHLQVYGRADEPCLSCKRPLHQLRLGGRATYYCSHCQR